MDPGTGGITLPLRLGAPKKRGSIMSALDRVVLASEFEMTQLRSEVGDLAQVERAGAQFYEAGGMQGG